MIKFSIIIPVYNAEMYIERCVRSIINQNYRDLEIVLINDGSKDNSGTMCTKLAEEDQRIIYKLQENQGPSIARQAGLALATGDYISFVDADDSLEEGLFEEIVPLCEQEIDIIEYGYYTVWDNNKVIHKLQCDRQEGINCLKHYIYQKNVTNYLCNKVFKKALFDGVEFPMMYLSEDQCILTQLYYNAQRTCTVGNAYYNYFTNPTSLCNSPFTH
ncbi:MAG: glycosyltransferase family 2 protein [Clostridia bacterium]|nr:glycosyltransferase family 2 protein [Clostridia bacterium]